VKRNKQDAQGAAPDRNAAQREAGGSYDYLYVDEQYPEEFSV